jgi:hypothetical protein
MKKAFAMITLVITLVFVFGGFAAAQGPTGSTLPTIAVAQTPAPVPGPAGPRGPQGLRGLQGPTGQQGAQGVQGVAGKDVDGALVVALILGMVIVGLISVVALYLALSAARPVYQGPYPYPFPVPVVNVTVNPTIHANGGASTSY